MKFNAGWGKIKFDDGVLIGSLEQVTLIADGVSVALAIVPMEEIQRLRKRHNQERAWPMYVGLAYGENAIHLWPRPHKSGELKIIYYPPMEEI
jgi:hypothetical protein